MSSNREKLESFGVPLDALDGVFEEKLRDLSRSVEGYASLSQRYGDELARRGPQLLQLAQEDAGYAALLKADATAGTEYGLLKLRALGVPMPAGPATSPMPTGSAPQLPPGQQTLSYGQQAAHVRDASRAERERYIHARLGQVVTDEFLNQ